VPFNNETRKNDTELSKHIWQLKNKQQHFNIKWKILAKAKPYSNRNDATYARRRSTSTG